MQARGTRIAIYRPKPTALLYGTLKPMTRNLLLILLYSLLSTSPAWAIAGDGFAIEKIEVRGNEKTKSGIILKALTFQAGETLSSAEVNASKHALIQTRLFKTVHLASKPGTDKEHAIVVVYVEERRFGELGISGEYTELDGFGVSADAYHVNLRGEGKIVGAAWGSGERFKQWRFDYADPWFTHADLLFSIGIRGSSADRDIFRDKNRLARGRYDLERIGGTLAIGRPIGPDHRLFFKYSFDEVQVGSFSRPEVVTDQEEFADEVGFAASGTGRESLAFIGLDLHRKPSLDPWGSTPGTEFSLKIDLSAKYLGSAATFAKLTGRFYRHFATRGRQILTVGARAGAVFGSEPFYERFFLDGDKQLRGFERREIGPEGGEEFAAAEVLYSIPFRKVGRVYGFLEGATVHRDFVTGSRGDQGATAGIGILLFNRVDISLGLGTGTLIVKSHRFGGINVGL
jgi:outer membrane protein assembly factor BamA